MADEVVYLTDGTTDIDFLAGEGAVSGYVRRNIEGLDPPPVEIRWAGNRPIYREWQNREITITFSIKGSTAADLAYKKRAIIGILENTFAYWVSNGERGAKAQFWYRSPGGTDISYTDIYWGECDWGRVEYKEGAIYANILKGAQLVLTCETCFHPLVPVTLVDDQSVYGIDDGTYNNYRDIDAADIEGDLDAPCNIRVRPASTFSEDIDKFWVAMVGPRASLHYWHGISRSYE